MSAPTPTPQPVLVEDRSHPLSGRTAIVTGGSRGIGLGICSLFVELGAKVLMVSRREESLAAAVAGICAGRSAEDSVSYRVGKADSDDDASESVATAIDRYGSLDILVNNAAANPYFGPLVGINRSQAEKTLAVNLWGPLSWIQAAWDQWMGEHGGAVLNIASTSGIDVDVDLGWYGTTKAGLIHMTKLLAMELAPSVRVNSIAPGLIKTDMSRTLWESGEDQIAATMPLHRLGTPRDIAEAAAFLCSPSADWVTGQTLVVDGGYLVRPNT